MKHWIYLLLLIFISCNNRQLPANNSDTLLIANATPTPKIKSAPGNEVCWAGTINGKIPVLIHYTIDSTLIAGEITYLNSKEKIPIQLLGTIEDDGSYRLLEFEKSGNITGIITGSPTDSMFNGTWFSPKTRKDLELSLIKKDTLIHSPTMDISLQDIFGEYHYQYTDAGSQGSLEISSVPGAQAAFEISSVTSEPSRNTAQVDRDTILLNTTQFTYRVPQTDSCEFKVKFYKGFAYIKYSKWHCEAQFGMNATVEGIFIKIK